MRWILSLIAVFALVAYLGVWLCGLVTEKPDAPAPPSLVTPSISQEVIPAPPPPVPSMPAVSAVVQPEVSEPIITISSVETFPGEYLVVTADGVPDGMLTFVNPFGEAPQAVATENGSVSLIPVKYTVLPGEYTLTAACGELTQEFLITVKEKAFAVQNIDVEESVSAETIESQTANDEYYSKIQPLKSILEPAPMWDGLFLSPVSDYRLTSQFGEIRTVNGVPGDRHGGIDMACNTGTPVLAANSGRVLFGEFVALTGNTVLIEHGLGLKTWYYHMDSLNIKTGDTVKKGQQIGAVGTTGFSTGPHLHFAVSVAKTYINPFTLLEHEVPLKEKS